MSTATNPADSADRRVSTQGANWLEVVEHHVNALKFGSVNITVHEGRVVQIEASVRVRFDKPQ